MKVVYVVIALLVSLIMVGVVVGQGTSPEAFQLVREIGQERPRGVAYDPLFDRFAMVTPEGQLVLVDAATFDVQHVLYQTGFYNAYRFSHDGRWLALAIERRIELWDTATGTLSVSLEPEGARAVQGPLMFSDDDHLLLFDSVVPAPDNLRQSEQDTVILPWLWDLVDARDEGRSSLPRRVEAFPIFNMRNGFVLGPNDIAIEPLPARLQLVDYANPDLPLLGEIESARNERDPLSVWFSLRGDQMYALPLSSSTLVQINTADGATTTPIRLGGAMDAAALSAFDTLVLSDDARIIGQPNTLQENAFLRLLLGENYHRSWNNHPLTIMLIDILQPVTTEARDMGFLIYIFDEQTGRGTLDFLRPADVLQMDLHPDGRQMMVRRASGSQPIEIYDLGTGLLLQTIQPALPDPQGETVLRYNAAGDAIVSDWQRFDAATGELLHQNLHLQPGFEQFYFTQEGDGLVTLRGSDWWLWDLETGEPRRRETRILHGGLMRTWPDGQRFLTQISDPAPGVEVFNIATGERQRVIFDELPNRTITSVLPSPDWLHFLVIYSADQYSPYYPGNEIAIYSLLHGRLWFLAGDDLPEPEARSYGWYDAQTVYVMSDSYGVGTIPERIYGLEYHGSGLPQCLVDGLPEDWPRWVGLWERLNNSLPIDDLGRLTQQLCAVMPGSVQNVEDVFHPTAVPTRIPMTATPALIAGVPGCLTARYGEQAQDYAAIWREITATLNEDDLREMENLLCEGLGGSRVSASSYRPYRGSGPQQDVMLIDIASGNRSAGTYLPPQEAQSPQRDVALVSEAFRREMGFTPESPLLSADGTLLAMRTYNGYVQVYRMSVPYDVLAADATATAHPPEEDRPQMLSILPTATRPFNDLGEPRPTLTPTVTPTPPPPAQATIAQTAYGEVLDICTEDRIYDISAPPAGYAPTGTLLVTMAHDSRVWRLNPLSGELRPDETISTDARVVALLARNEASLEGQPVQLSPDSRWMLVQGDEIAVSRLDGSDRWVLFEARERAVWPDAIYWLTADTLEYTVNTYLPDQRSNPTRVYYRAHADSQTLEGPLLDLYPPITINTITAEEVAPQPGDGPLHVVRTPYQTMNGTEYKYYIYDEDTDTADYFARVASDLTFTWHPTGRALYYRYAGEGSWTIYDAVTRTHAVLGTLPGGDWSPDARYRAIWIQGIPEGYEPTLAPYDYVPPTATATAIPTLSTTPVFVTQHQALIAPPNDVRRPKLTIWDSETGQTRRYCVPGMGRNPITSALVWSPDGRYIAFQANPTMDNGRSVQRPRLMLLDTQTGEVTTLTFEIDQIVLWTTDDALREGE